MSNRRHLRLLVPAVAVLGLTLAACGAPGSSSEDDVVVIGVMGAADSQWEVFADQANEAGIEVEIKDFSNYQLLNPGLTEGELDLNQFQHLQFLADYNDNTGEDLVPIGATAVYPLNVYSTEFTSVDDIPEGSSVAVPNDATNLARALLNLQDAGLITLRDGGNSFSTEADVLPESKVTVTAVDAAQTAIALTSGSVQAAVINNDFVADANLTTENVVFADEATGPEAEPYINIFAAAPDEKDNETFLKLVEVWHSPEVQEAVTADSGGLAIFNTTSAADLQQILADIQSARPAK